MKDVDINTIKYLPNQSVIYYETIKGIKCIRVISQII